MTNQEIIDRIDSILADNSNYCDQILAIKAFNKEYKKSDFYKQTRMPLEKLIASYKVHRLVNLDILVDLIQNKINDFDLSSITSLLDRATSLMRQDVEDLNSSWEELQDIKNIFKSER